MQRRDEVASFVPNSFPLRFNQLVSVQTINQKNGKNFRGILINIL